MSTFVQRILIVIVIAMSAGGVSASGPALDPQDCTQSCLIRIEGVQPTYSATSESILTLYNQSDKELSVNVAIEILHNAEWVELSGSVSDSRYAFAKVKRFRNVKAGSSVKLHFRPCDIAVLDADGGRAKKTRFCLLKRIRLSSPVSLRLRADVFSPNEGQIVQRVRSEVFQFSM